MVALARKRYGELAERSAQVFESTREAETDISGMPSTDAYLKNSRIDRRASSWSLLSPREVRNATQVRLAGSSPGESRSRNRRATVVRVRLRVRTSGGTWVKSTV